MVRPQKGHFSMLDNFFEPSKILLRSLSNFELLTCDACNSCIETYKCIKDDGLNKIFTAMEQAEGIIFGAPEYWTGMNAKGRAFWERICFSIRHNSYFPLQDKTGVIVGISGDGDSTAVLKDIGNFFNDAQIEVEMKVEVQGEYACFTCGCGGKCSVGGLAEIYDLPLKITGEKVPDFYNQHPERAGKRKDIVTELKQVGRKLFQLINDND